MVRQKAYSKTRGGIVAAVDAGSSKVCCVIADLSNPNKIEIIGTGHQASRGIRAGMVADIEETITSIVNAVHRAEKMAGVTVQYIFVNMNGSHLQSKNFYVEIDIGGHAVDDGDIKRVISQIRGIKTNDSQQTVHTIPTSYRVDKIKGIRDPRGMLGKKLGVNIHLVTGDFCQISNLATCVARSHLDISGSVVSSYASGLVTLVEDEMDLGATVIDMGGGTTSFSTFYEGQLLCTGCIPIGGIHVTTDIARGLSTPLAYAERLKTLYGSAILVSDDREMITVPQVGEDKGGVTNQFSKYTLTSIISPRIEETFEHVKQKLLQSGLDSVVGCRVVLTGGASQLGGVREVAAKILNKRVRLGKPLYFGASEFSNNPSFSVCLGLLSYMQSGVVDSNNKRKESMAIKVANKVGSWVRTIW